MSTSNPPKRLAWLDKPLMLGHAHKFDWGQKAIVTIDELRPALPEDCMAVLAWDEDMRAGAVEVLYLKRPAC